MWKSVNLIVLLKSILVEVEQCPYAVTEGISNHLQAPK